MTKTVNSNTCPPCDFVVVVCNMKQRIERFVVKSGYIDGEGVFYIYVLRKLTKAGQGHNCIL